MCVPKSPPPPDQKHAYFDLDIRPSRTAMSGMFSTPATPADHLEEYAENDHVMVKQGTAEGVRGSKTSTHPGRIVEVIRNEQREVTHYVVKKFIGRSSGEKVERQFVFKDTDFGMQPINGTRARKRDLAPETLGRIKAEVGKLVPPPLPLSQLWPFLPPPPSLVRTL